MPGRRKISCVRVHLKRKKGEKTNVFDKQKNTFIDRHFLVRNEPMFNLFFP